MIWFLLVVDAGFSLFTGVGLARAIMIHSWLDIAINLLLLIFWLYMFIKDTRRLRE